jgi:hypothetical protein
VITNIFYIDKISKITFYFYSPHRNLNHISFLAEGLQGDHKNLRLLFKINACCR